MLKFLDIEIQNYNFCTTLNVYTVNEEVVVADQIYKFVVDKFLI